MAQTSRIMISIGDGVLIDGPDGPSAGGIAFSYARAAAKFGHHAVPISRLGQDDRSQRVRELLKHDLIDLSLLQSDPDLPTARLSIQRLAGRERLAIEPHAAFDALQWDFDLQDIAPRAEAVFFGLTAQRSAQSGSVIRRFLDSCTTSLRVADFSQRAERRAISHVFRNEADSLLERCEILFVDDAGWRELRFGGERPTEDGVRSVLRRHGLAVALVIDSSQEARLHTTESNVPLRHPIDESRQCDVMVAVVGQLLDGAAIEDVASAGEQACSAGSHDATDATSA
ncbi:MAG: carbohydrate kinase family protein [Phycisphaerales bacterium]|nr:MAG: carbohydrate kinase family protein [Phycisphaerales bacterium]